MTARTLKTFPLFELTIIVALALIGWVAFRLYQIVPEVDQSRDQLAQVRSQYFAISDAIQSNVTRLDEALRDCLERKDPAQLQRYSMARLDFEQWLDREARQWTPSRGTVAAVENTAQPRSPSGTNRWPQIQGQLHPVLGRVQAAFTDYTNAAQYLIQNSGKPLIRPKLAARQQTLQDSASLMLALAEETRTDGENLESYLSWPQARYAHLKNHFQNMRFALLLALIGLSFLLMLVIYRGKLAQTRHIIEQQKRQQIEQQGNLDKLTHFGRLAHELAHEIKQPLTAISARIYALQKSLPPNNEAHKDAALVRSEIKRLNQIVKDFQELARPGEPKLVPLTAGDALHEVSDLMGSQLQQEGIEVQCAAEPEVKVMADPHQLEQVLLNLVRNAAESLDGPGTITLRARKDNRPLHGQTAEVAAIEVADTGPGIPPEVQNRIFDPFFSTKAGGTGLGLAIAARIIDKHGGNLEFETELGKGTVFRIVLPVAENNRHEQSATHRG